MRDLGLIFLIGCCGGIGALLRYAVSSWAASVWATTFPAGTFLVNVVGCGLAGAFAQASVLTSAISPGWRMAIMVGLLGGLTTFSTFGVETIGCLTREQWNMALANVAANVLLGLLAVWVGAALARGLLG